MDGCMQAQYMQAMHVCMRACAPPHARPPLLTLRSFSTHWGSFPAVVSEYAAPVLPGLKVPLAPVSCKLGSPCCSAEGLLGSSRTSRSASSRA